MVSAGGGHGKATLSHLGQLSLYFLRLIGLVVVVYKTFLVHNALPSFQLSALMDAVQIPASRKGSSLVDWPQSDKRSATAIADGELIGPHLSAGSRHTTVVTAYYEFESKHGVRSYEGWFEKMLKMSDPLIVFVEPNSTWSHFVRGNRSRLQVPTILVEQPFNSMVMSTSFEESFWQEQRNIDLEAHIHRGTGVYKIWNEKLVLLKAAADVNPFGTEYFAWTDAGYYRPGQSPPNDGSPAMRLNITKAGVPKSKLLLLHVRNNKRSNTGFRTVATAGNMFVGHADAINAIYYRYYTTLWDMVTNNLFVGSDQMVMTETCYRYPSVCHPYFPGRYKAWLHMATVLSKEDHDLSQLSPDFEFGAPPASTELLPFPKDTVVTMANLRQSNLHSDDTSLAISENQNFTAGHHCLNEDFKPRHEVAIWTMLNDNPQYVSGAVKLGRALARHTVTPHDRVVMELQNKPLSDESWSDLKSVGYMRCVVSRIPPPNPEKTRHDLQEKFAVLHIWAMTVYSRMVFLDADTYARASIDHLLTMDLEGKPVGVTKDIRARQWVDTFNTGVLLINPNLAEHNRLVKLLASGIEFDYVMSDQGFLNEVYGSNWHEIGFVNNANLALYRFKRDFWDQHKVEDINIIHYTMQKPWKCQVKGPYGPICGIWVNDK